MGVETFLHLGLGHTCPSPGYPEEERLVFVERLNVTTVRCRRLLKAQIDLVSRSDDIVLFTLGGSDIGFESIVKQCFIIGYRDPGGCREQITKANDTLNSTFRANLVSVLERIIGATRSDTKIVMLGYPYLERYEDLTIANLLTGDSYDVGREVRRLGERGDEIQRSVFNSVLGSEVGTRGFYRLSEVKAAFAGPPSHEPEASGSNPDRWVNEALDTRITSEWYHPNPRGHEAYADILRKIAALEEPTPRGTPEGSIDVVFVIDTTGSMGDDIDGVKAFSSRFVDDLSLRTSSYRVAVVDYRDFPERTGSSGDYPARIRLNFSNDKSSIQRAIQGLDLGDGGDTPETAWSGLKTGIDLPWRPGVKKVIIQLGDAPPLDPEPITGLTASDIVAAARAVDPANVYVVDVSSSGQAGGPELERVARETGGRVIPSASPEDIEAALTEIVNDAVSRPFAFLDGPYLTTVGDTVTLDGSGSFDNDGAIVKYEWDVDGDAVYDQTTTTPTLSHVFTSPFDGMVGLFVTDEAGLTAEATAIARATIDGDEIPEELDNCPNDNNPDQADDDGDGTGDVCDPTPFPVVDKEGVQVSRGLRPVPFTIAGHTDESALYATGSPNTTGGTTGTVTGVVRGQPIPSTAITEAGLTTIAGQEVLAVRFSAGGQPWELRYRSGLFGFGFVGSLELCGPPGCETGTGVKFSTAGVPIQGFGSPPPGSTTSTTVATSPGSSTATSIPAGPTTTLSTTTTTTTPPVATSVNTTTPTSRCTRLQKQLEHSDIRTRESALRAVGCPV